MFMGCCRTVNLRDYISRKLFVSFSQYMFKAIKLSGQSRNSQILQWNAYRQNNKFKCYLHPIGYLISICVVFILVTLIFPETAIADITLTNKDVLDENASLHFVWLDLQWLKDNILTYQTLFGGALGASLGYLAKWVFDQWSAERDARRKFAQSITEQISGLAKDYYWSLANCAGVVAGLLESYLDDRTHHYIVVWRDRAYLSERLDEIADNVANNSFYHFCRLIGLFEKFQFQKSNTYLLTNHAAGETSKRLYNAFIASLPPEEPEKGIDLAKIVKVLREEKQVEGAGKPIPVSEFPEDAFMQDIANNELKEQLKAYKVWIRCAIPSVEEATDALRAYNELLNHELARLYKDFFKKNPPGTSRYLGSIVFDDWPNVLTEQSYFAIEKSSMQSALLRPLGGGMQPGKQASGESSHEPGDEHPEDEGQIISQSKKGN